MKSKTPGIEESIGKLEGILEKMSDANTTLEESISLYAEASGLVRDASEGLAKAKVQIEEIDQKLESVRETDEL